MSNQESYGKGWLKLNLMVNPDTEEIHFVGGDLVEGDGDRPFKAAQYVQFRKINSGSEKPSPNKSSTKFLQQLNGYLKDYSESALAKIYDTTCAIAFVKFIEQKLRT